MNRYILILSVIFNTTILCAQRKIEIRGSIFSEQDKSPVLNSSVILQKINTNGEKKIVTYSFSQIKGFYSFKSNFDDTSKYIILASHINFEKQELPVIFSSVDSVITIDFFLTPSAKQLKEIIIENKEPVRIKKDTVEFKADSFRTPQTRKVEDLIKNIEGFKVESDGRITYRGKEVKALLLDGDDLTQDQYQLLTRNLNADMIDRLQVIDNYHKNRIMGGLIESDKAAINLKLKKGMQGKLNGSTSAAGSPEGRYELDATLVWLKSKFKMVYLLNGNSIAKDATGLLRYQEFGNAGGLQQQEELTKKIINGTGLVSTGTVAAPDISREYVLDNRNWFTSPLFHTRISKSLKLAVRFYGVADRLNFSGGSSSFTNVNQQLSWNLNSKQQSTIRRNNISGAAELTHDNQKKFAGNLNLQAGWVKDNNRFSNFTGGFFTDTLSENSNAARWGYAAAYTAAVKLSNFNVLSIQSSASFIPEQKVFNIQTNRLRLFYNLPQGIDIFQQNTETDVLGFQTSISFIQKKASTTFSVGYENNWQKLKIENRVVTKTNQLTAVNRQTGFLQNRIHFVTTKRLTGKSSVKLTVNGGAGSVADAHLTNQYKTFLLWKVTAGYKYKIKAFSGLNIQFTSLRELPDILLFYPANMISANASVISGTQRIQPVEAYTSSLSFSNFKIMSKQSLLVSANIRYAKTDYTGNFQLFPEYNITTWGLVKNNRQAGVNFDFGSFVFALNSTFRLSSFASYGINNQLVNSKEVQNNNTVGSFTCTWVPSFKIPIGWQIDFSKSFFYNEQKNEMGVIKNNNKTTNFLVKLRSDFKGNYYIGSQYNFLQLSPGRKFHLLSIFQNLVITQKLNADFVIHNVLNNRNYTERITSPNAVYENSFSGVGRYFLLKLHWSF